jgi:hypothetical protein
MSDELTGPSAADPGPGSAPSGRYRFPPDEGDRRLALHILGYCLRRGVDESSVTLLVNPADLPHFRRFPSYRPAAECDGFLCGRPIFADRRVTPARVQLEPHNSAAHWNGRMTSE